MPGVVTALLTMAVVASLYFGRDIFVPLALAVLLSFALAPPVRWLRRAHLPRLPAVLIVVTLAFAFIVAFSSIVALQVADLAQQLPSYQKNIEAKISSFREAPPGGRLFERASNMLRDLGRQIDGPPASAPEQAVTNSAATDESKPIPVEIHEPEASPIELLETVLGPLMGPLATAGIVIVLVIFMLLKREDLRDRLIRLAGSRDLSRTTEALDDAGQRVGQYLLMQLVVNATYGLPIGIGLWLIGLPNPILWGLLATVLRFVPYIGPVIAAFFPLALAVAVDPGWATLLWAGALFIVVELISNNAVEPWLYGASTGLSPVAVIAAAVFWTWLWGPIGLLLSTPLTVCLVVLGRHVPQLAYLDVLLGSEPVLTPPETLYQRLLVGDPNEATERAEEYIRQSTLTDFYDDVAIAALALAEHDRMRGHLDDDRRGKVADSTLMLIDNLAEYEETPPQPETAGDTGPAAVAEIVDARALPLTGHRVLCGAARGNLDEAAAAMLAQLLERQGASVEVVASTSLHSAHLRELDVDEVRVVVLSYMNADSLAHARFLVRRLRRRIPKAAIIVGFWTFSPSDTARRDPLAATGADRVATTLQEAVKEVLAEMSPDLDEPVAAAPMLTLAAVANP